MPTSANLIGGLLLALTAIISSYFFISSSPPVRTGIEFYIASALIGFIVGWRSIGSDPGFGGMGSIVSGLRGTFLLVFYSAAIFGIWIVIIKLMGFFIKNFKGVFDSWFQATMSYYSLITEPYVIFALVAGGCISGIGAGLANRHWS